MAAFRDTNGKLRMQYFDKMSHAESLYENMKREIEVLRARRGRDISGTALWNEITRNIEVAEATRDRHLAEFHAYAAALAAVSTAILK